MKRIWIRLFSKRTGAVFTLLTFLPSSVNAQMLLPVTVATAVTAQASDPIRDDESAQPIAAPGEPEPIVSGQDSPRLKRALPEPFVLAQAIPIPPAASVPALNPDAQAILNDAASYQTQGDVVNGALALFRLMEQYPNSLEASQGIKALTQYALSMLSGTYSSSILDAFEQQLPTWENCNAPESKFVLMGFNYYRAMFAQGATNEVDANKYFGRAYNDGFRFLEEYPQNPLILPVLQYLMASAQALGPETLTLTVAELSDRLNKAPDFNTWCIHGVFG